MSKNIDQSLVWDEEEIGPGVDPEQEAVKGQVEKDLLAAEARNRRLLFNQRLRIGISLPFWLMVALLWGRIMVDALAGPRMTAYQALYAQYTDPVMSMFTGHLPLIKFNSFSTLELGYVIAIAVLIALHRLVMSVVRALA